MTAADVARDSGPGQRPLTATAWEGVRDITPMVVGIVPFGLALGAVIGASSVDTAAGLASAPLVLAGAAQLATLQMLEAGTDPIVIVVSALVINARILLYGASLAPWFSEVSLPRRLLLAIPVIDQTHFVCDARFARGDLDQRGRVAYYAAAGSWLVAAWLLSQIVAVVLGAGLPDGAHLEFAAPLALTGLLARAVTRPAAVVAAVAAAGIAATGGTLPMHSSMLAATFVGIGAGLVLDRRARHHTSEDRR